MKPKNKTAPPRIQQPNLPASLEALLPTKLDNGSRHSDFAACEWDIAGQAVDALYLEYFLAERANFTNTRLLNLKLHDARIQKCDLSNANWSYSFLERIEFIGDRLTGLKLNEATLRDIKLSGCKGDLAQFRYATFRDALFEDCVLTEADFQCADLRGVSFAGCDVRGANFSGAKLEGADFRGALLDGMMIQPADLKGVIIDEDQAFALSSYFAKILGVDVRAK